MEAKIGNQSTYSGAPAFDQDDSRRSGSPAPISAAADAAEASPRVDSPRGSGAGGGGAFADRQPQPGEIVVEAVEVERRFGSYLALKNVSFAARRGEVHALLGTNGAGKTTLLRVLSGLQDPTSGSVRMPSLGGTITSRGARQRMGIVPSGDRTFYNRISGLENLLFFCRLHGLRKAAATARGRELLQAVGLADVANQPVGTYSHGMQKRLGVARGLLMSPDVLFIDEATHDLDPAGAQRIRDLVRSVCDDGAAVVWTTQRVEEIRGFANRVTVLDRGEVRFVGSVPQLVARSLTRRFVLRLQTRGGGPPAVDAVRGALAGIAQVEEGEPGDIEHFLVALAADSALGDAVLRLADCGVLLTGCNEERPEVEVALLSLTTGR